MACTNVPRLLVDRPVATTTNLPNGLLAAATVVEDMDPHAYNGVEYVAVCDPAVKPYPVGECSEDPNPPKTSDRSRTIVTGDPFALYAAEACPSTRAELAAARNILADRFTAGEQHTLEAVVNNGWVGARPFLRDPEGEVISTDPVSLVTAIGLLEHRLAVLGLPATIHAPRWMAQQLPGLVREAGQVFTRLGSRIVFGSGYDGAPPMGVEDEEGTWLYATGPITISRSPLIYPADASSGAFDPATNSTFALMERVYVVDWPCQVVAVPTTVPNPGPLFTIPTLPPDLVVEPAQGAAPLEVTATVDNHGQGPVLIDFGDGTTPVQVEDGASTTHTYAQPGNYTVTASSVDEPAQRTIQHVSVSAPTISPVTDLEAVGGAEQITLSWEWEQGDGPDADAFQIQYRPHGSTEWLNAPQAASDARTATLEGLDPSTAYQVRVRAQTGDFSGPWANATATTQDAIPLSAPTQVEATTSGEQITATWEWAQGEGPEATGFTVTASPTTGEELTATVDADARTATLDGAAPNTTYTVTVTAHATDEDAASDPVEVTTDPVPLAAPTDVAAQDITHDQATVTWDWEQGQGPEATGFTVTANDESVDVDAQARTATLDDLTPSTEYALTVAATDGTDTATSTPPVEFTTDPEPAPPAPVAPTIVDATDLTLTSYVLHWEWEQADGGPVEEFEVTYTHPDDGPQSVTTPGADRQVELDGLESGTGYSNTVTARNAGGEATSGSFTVQVPAQVADPTDVAVGEATPDTLTVTWEFDAGFGPTPDHFTLRYRTPAGTGTWAEAPNPSGTARTATLTGLDADTEYEVEVTAVAEHSASTPVTATGTTTTAP